MANQLWCQQNNAIAFCVKLNKSPIEMVEMLQSGYGQDTMAGLMTDDQQRPGRPPEAITIRTEPPLREMCRTERKLC